MTKSVVPASREVVFQEFSAVGKYRVRLVRDADLKGPVLLDIREYVDGSNFSGFTRRGIRLDLAALKALKPAIDLAIAQLETKS